MAECFSVACYVGHQPGGSYRTLGFSFEYLYCFFFQFHLGIKSAAGFIAAPAIGPKAKPSQITHVKFYKKNIAKGTTDTGVDCFDRFCVFCTFCTFCK